MCNNERRNNRQKDIEITTIMPKNLAPLRQILHIFLFLITAVGYDIQNQLAPERIT